MPEASEPSASGSMLPPSKAIGSLAKKQADITRHGTQKLKFVPTLPVRRKKE
jgi:DNA-directed RNA polymerase III subunit RPC4